jgi:hypothetical protein
VAEASDASDRPVRGTWRVRVRFDGTDLAVTEQSFADMIAPYTPGAPPGREDRSGAWFEVRDAKDEVLAYQRLHDPFQIRAEHHSPEGQIEVFERKVETGEFELLVPALPEAESVVVFSSPVEPGRTADAAKEVARFELKSRNDKSNVDGDDDGNQ